ncbi:Paraquat-inducible protein A [endosymbiont of Ridgeia piscesae]|jgi:hypothetical protein|uniref:Paraquat-inducible protein A n=1 Tax=endosymbiont of Ridgeia piscesae TaxID=54398 RepID=A0A0T5YWM6_9GAMM|nr:paraquat-inducible protein A [endosymbiont of Ridgeia piscesae]KRT54999.1 Paraquat-inducible protein A [endosymbiont of Ridgeia piscesae]
MVAPAVAVVVEPIVSRAYIWAAIAALALFLLLCSWLTWQQAHAYERETLYIVQQLEAGNRLESVGREWLETLTLGLYDSSEAESQQTQGLYQHKQLQQAYKESVEWLLAAFILTAAGLFLLSWLLNRRWIDLGYMMLLVALISLLVGLTTPILSVEASKELPLLGETVFQFKSKGILSTIGALWQNGNLWLTLLLFLFSVVLPLLKTLLVTITLWNSEHHLIRRGLHFSHQIGKWSMADVFVVAILVAYFANSGQDLTEAEVQVGLVYFAAYVVLSLLGTQLVVRQLAATKLG